MLCAVSCLLPALASGDIPKLIRYQGQALDANGVPLEGPYTLTFRLYDAETAGTKIWEETQTSVPISSGQFSVLLGQVAPFTTDWSAPSWLSLQVGAEAELSPRQRITAVPLALRAETAERLAGSAADVSVRAYNSNAVSVPNNTELALPFDSEVYDTGDLHSTATSATRLVAKTAGKYLILGNVNWAGYAGGVRNLTVRVNGATDVASMNLPGSAVSGQMFIVAHYTLAVNDYVELFVYQDSGAARNINASGPFSPSFTMVKVP
ncbi:MAG: hypothetical protein HYY15_03640 [Candidatus Omnitrophica bacterium]|nr:hypothetical protein [Candidatus Omnitrophota bacterium]